MYKILFVYIYTGVPKMYTHFKRCYIYIYIYIYIELN